MAQKRRTWVYCGCVYCVVFESGYGIGTDAVRSDGSANDAHAKHVERATRMRKSDGRVPAVLCARAHRRRLFEAAAISREYRFRRFGRGCNQYVVLSARARAASAGV